MEIIWDPSTYHKFAFNFPFIPEVVQFCREIKESMGWRTFTYSEKAWRFSDPRVAAMIKKKYPQVVIAQGILGNMEGVLLEMRQEEIREERAYELKTATTSSLDKIFGIKGDPYPYQKVAVEFFINNNGRAILADDPGTGKTLMSLAFVAHTKKQRTLVICPSSVKYSWESEVEKWTKLKAVVITSKTDWRDIDPKTNVYIINYDILKKHFKELSMFRWDCLILDEFHLVKNNAAQRTKAVKAIGKNIQSIILLSGTPILSRPVELFNGLAMLDPRVWNNYFDYTKRYCDGKQGYFGYEARGATNIEELKTKIAKYFLRRRKTDVLKDLPEKVFIDVPVMLDEDTRKEYKTAEKEFATYLRENKGMRSKEILKTLQGEKLTKINYLRQITSAGKVPHARELIENLVDSGQKVLVFSVYNEPLERLFDGFPGISVMVNGKMNAEDRQVSIKRFQEDESVRVFFGGMVSAGVGITLTQASAVVFLDYSWVPAEHIQAQDRAHRPGATADRLTIYQLYSKNTIDNVMSEILKKKQHLFDTIIDGRVKPGEKGPSIISELIKSLEGVDNLPF